MCVGSAVLIRLLRLFDLGEPHQMFFIQNVQTLQNLFLQLSLIIMSFYLVNKPLNAKVQVEKAPIVFISLFEVKSSSRVLATINSDSILSIYDLNRGQVLLQVRLILQKQLLLPLLKSYGWRDLVLLQTKKCFYFVKFQEILQQVENLKNIGEVKVKNMRIVRIVKQSKDVTQTWLSLLNKDIKLINKGEKTIIKIGGRKKKLFKYCFGVFDQENYIFKIDSQWQGQFNYQYSMGLESLSNNFIIYQTYIFKGKPIKLYIGNSISSQYGEKEQFVLSETEIIHFYEQITIIDIALLNDQLVCIFGNNSYQDISSSLMIVYNVRHKYTLNYLAFKEASLQRLFWFLQTQYQFDYKYSLVYFDAIELGQKSSLLYQLYPNSYQTDQFFKLNGKIIEANKDYIFTRTQDQLFIYPKLHKRAIYFKWMNELGVYDLQCLTMIAQFLQ